MVATMDPDQIEEMSAAHLAEALYTVGADYIGAGTRGFGDIDAVDTLVFARLGANIEAPDSLTEVMDSEGAARLFGSMFN